MIIEDEILKQYLQNVVDVMKTIRIIEMLKNKIKDTIDDLEDEQRIVESIESGRIAGNLLWIIMLLPGCMFYLVGLVMFGYLMTINNVTLLSFAPSKFEAIGMLLLSWVIALMLTLGTSFWHIPLCYILMGEKIAEALDYSVDNYLLYESALKNYLSLCKWEYDQLERFSKEWVDFAADWNCKSYDFESKKFITKPAEMYYSTDFLRSGIILEQYKSGMAIRKFRIKLTHYLDGSGAYYETKPLLEERYPALKSVVDDINASVEKIWVLTNDFFVQNYLQHRILSENMYKETAFWKYMQEISIRKQELIRWRSELTNGEYTVYSSPEAENE